jgi:hypothetical protein
MLDIGPSGERHNVSQYTLVGPHAPFVVPRFRCLNFERVITPSVKNGALVLRHEPGHSIMGVGEKHDGVGGDCFGVETRSRDFSGSHWMELIDPAAE